MNQNPSEREIIQKLQKDLRNINRKHQNLNTKFFQLHELLISEEFFNNVQPEKAEPFLPITKLINRESEILVLAFGGMASRLGMPPFEFLNSFRKRDVSCLFFKDFHQFWYQQGLLGLTENVDETQALIQSMIKDIAPRKIFSIGTSAGGYAAIMFGVLLGVSKVLAFGPQTKVGNRVLQEFSSLDTPEINLKRAEPNRIIDLEKLIANNLNSVPETNIYFAELNKTDKMHAERLMKFKNIHLHPIPKEQSHNIALSLKKQGKLDSIIDEFLS